ncbi:MAG: hypothetical protein C4589_11240 [Peptococcaceae bacterium]|jgi:hypothetical protein|nr:MAG: hypothetical protein C4589_11240 [Peptococcaceae bacterium]
MPELYSKNKLTNPSAETGDTAGWTASGVTVVDGGTDGGKCFRLNTSADMYQEQAFSVQPSDFKIAADFLPEYEQPETETGVRAYLKLEYEYADGMVDTFILPCRIDAVI